MLILINQLRMLQSEKLRHKYPQRLVLLLTIYLRVRKHEQNDHRFKRRMGMYCVGSWHKLSVDPA